MKIKTSELSGASLDWAVATVEGIAYRLRKGRVSYIFIESGVTYKPSTNAAIAMHIIMHKMGRVDLIQYEDKGYSDCDMFYDGRMIHMRGDDIIIAAMRCYVASRFGDVVDVPDELI